MAVEVGAMRRPPRERGDHQPPETGRTGRSPLEALVARPSQCLEFGSRASSLGEKESLVL